MVRTADSARSTAAVIAPTSSCACRDSRRTPREASTAVVDAERDGDDGEQQQPAVDQRHRDQRADADDRRAGDLDDAGGDRRAQQRGVGADPRHQVAGAPPVVLGDRQPQQPVGERRRVVRTTPSAVRCSRYCWAAPSAEAATRTTTSSDDGGQQRVAGADRVDDPARRAPAGPAPRRRPTSDSAAAATSGRRCGRSSGSSSRRPAAPGRPGRRSSVGGQRTGPVSTRRRARRRPR